MNIGQMLRESGAIESIANELGVDPQMAQTGASVLLPAIIAGMGRSSAGSGGLGGLIGALGGGSSGGGSGGGIGGDLLDLVLGNQPTPVDRGNDILGQIFGNKDVSRSVASEAAGASGLSSDLLKRMLPMLAMAAAGYMAKRAMGGGAAGGASQSGSASSASAQPDLGGLIGSIIGGLARR